MRLYSYVKLYASLLKKDVELLNEQGKILVDDKKVNLSHIVKDGEVVKVNGVVINEVPNIYYLYNKPKGLICTSDTSNPLSIFNHIYLDDKVFTVGRLDKDTTGLLILTNDGQFSHNVLSKDTHLEKEYEVVLENNVTESFLNNIVKSYNLRGKMTLPAKIVSYHDNVINLILYEGMYHEVKRIVKLSGNKVVELKRVRIGKVLLNDLELGKIVKVDNLKEII